jgi:sugar lactone lactonase YvrE
MNFYPVPPVIQAELYVRIPDKLRCPGENPEWQTWSKDPFDIFLEGPVADKDGGLYVVDIPFGRILYISPSKEVSVCVRYDGEPNGLAATPDGQIVVADYKQVSGDIQSELWQLRD